LAFLTPLAVGLKANSEGGAGQLFRGIADRLEEAKLENVSAVLLLDDLDRAAAKTLLLVERLLAIADVPLTIVGAAKPETARRIGQRLLGQATLRIDLHPWNEEETREYLTNSLSSAGRLQPAFDEAATRRLFELSGGAPRKVNQLAQLALLAGVGEKLTQIDVETIEAVREELSMAR
jgi:type II secretory pathway predicted ATPase ExeA